MPKPRMYEAGVAGSGRPQLIPNTVALRHGLMTWPAALNIGAVGHSMLGEQVDPEHVPHRARVEVGEALAEHRVHRDQQAHRQQDRQAAAGRVHAALLVELRHGRLLLDPVALVLALQLLDLGLEQLHLARRHELAPVERDHDQAGGRSSAAMMPNTMFCAGQLVEEDEPDEQPWKIGVNSHATVLIGLTPGTAGSSGAWLGVGVTVGRAAPGGRRRAASTRRRCSAIRMQEQDRREADEERAEAGHAVWFSQVQRTGS